MLEALLLIILFGIAILFGFLLGVVYAGNKANRRPRARQR